MSSRANSKQYRSWYTNSNYHGCFYWSQTSKKKKINGRRKLSLQGLPRQWQKKGTWVKSQQQQWKRRCPSKAVQGKKQEDEKEKQLKKINNEVDNHNSIEITETRTRKKLIQEKPKAPADPDHTQPLKWYWKRKRKEPHSEARPLRKNPSSGSKEVEDPITYHIRPLPFHLGQGQDNI